MNYIIMVSSDRNGGIRRYQNPDGSLTDAGRKRYASEAKKNIGNRDKIKNTEAYKKAYNSISKKKMNHMITKNLKILVLPAYRNFLGNMLISK